jgi:hypothetical protein
MKEMKCLECDEKFKANNGDEMLQAMMPHYKEAHSEMMKNGTDASRNEWFLKFDKYFQEAEVI